jgi:hypothetical protein
MSYTINKTDGSILATVADGQLDQLSSDLTLVGKNYSGFGESLNENFVKLLENFSNSSQPNYPVKGQLWFDECTNHILLQFHPSMQKQEYQPQRLPKRLDQL